MVQDQKKSHNKVLWLFSQSYSSFKPVSADLKNATGFRTKWKEVAV